MTTVTDIRNAGPVTLLKRPLYEPINAPVKVQEIIQKDFGDNYNINYNSNLFKFVLGLIGDNGIASLTRSALTAKIQDHLAATFYSDLDKFYGNAIGLQRLPEETYSHNPFTDALTSAEWDVINAADASYRHRCLTWMRALLFGGSPIGMALAGEAASGVECDIFEQYRYLDDTSLTNLGQTTSRSEFIVIPRTPTLSQAQHREIVHRVNRLKPANTLATINRQDQGKVAISIGRIDASSTGFLVKRLVTGRSDINWPTPDASQGYWITTSEQEAPTKSHITTQETSTYLTVSNVTASSQHVGVFTSMERGLFPILGLNTDPFFVYKPLFSYVSNSTPISISSPWFQR